MDKGIDLWVIDAFGVATEVGMGNRINTIMQTCFFAISGVLPREEAIKQIKKAIQKTYGKKGEAVVQKNFRAVDDTLAHLYEVNVPGKVTATRVMPPIVSDAAPDFVKRVTAVMMAAGYGPAEMGEMLLDGGAGPLADLKGQVVLVNFWATWCPPCRAELPGLESVYEAKHADGFTIVGVSMDQVSRAQVASFLREHGIQYPIAVATPDVVAAFGGVNSFPTSFLLDAQGRVRYTVHGMFATPTLRAAVNRLLAERG